MDDFILIHHDKKYLEYCLKCIENKLKNFYKLEINKNKTKIDNIKNGIDFLGYRFYIKNNRVIMKLKNSTKKKFKKKVKKVNLLLKYNLISDIEAKKILSSYKGLLMYGSCNNLYYKNVGEKYDRKIL